MQLTQPVQILAVEGRNVNTKRGPSTVFDVKASDGNEYSTFKAPLAQKAQQAIGQGAVTLGFETKVNGQYTNLILEEVVGGGDTPVATGVEHLISGTQTQPVTIATAPPIPIAPPVNQGEKDRKITRLAAQKTAFAFASHYVDEGLDGSITLARRLVEELITHAHTGQWPGTDVEQKEDASGITW